MKKRFGNIARLSLNYDLTFLSMLLSSLYEPATQDISAPCIVHPFSKQHSKENDCISYSADILIILSHFKALDDWTDEKNLIKKFFASYTKSVGREAFDKYHEKAEIIAKNLSAISKLEASSGDKGSFEILDALSGHFGNILAEIFAYRHDEWEISLRKTGFYLGKFIYILDAFDDLEKDNKKGLFNPLRIEREDITGCVHELLLMSAAECAREFEKLPLEENIEILRNILYSGIWTKYPPAKQAEKGMVTVNEKSL